MQLLQEVQLYQNLVQECMGLMQEDLYGGCVLKRTVHNVLLQVVHEVQLLQEVQLYQNFVQECTSLIQEDLHGVCVLHG